MTPPARRRRLLSFLLAASIGAAIAGAAIAEPEGAAAAPRAPREAAAPAGAPERQGVPIEQEGQAKEGSSGSQEAQANNPLANLTALNFQNYYITDLSRSDENANQAFIRLAQPVATPIGSWLVRATLPILRQPTGPNDTESGLGDLDVFATYLFDTGNPARSVGLGPLLKAPTATSNDTGTDQWSAGAAAVLFDATNPVLQWGGLVTYLHKFAGSERVQDVNTLAIQPFGFVQIGQGFYFRAAPIWVFNLENDDFSVPVGIGVGKVVKLGTTVMNFFIEPQYSILDDGPNQPEFQIFAALNLQFYGR